jgi:hypothetical protein
MAEAESGELSGAWALSTEIESSSVNSFEGLRLGYRVRLEQNGNEVRGAGRKISENGRPIAAAGQTPIDVHGKIEGDRVRLTFTEQGTARQSSGIFDLVREGDALYGRFSSTAARSRGSVDARRQ